MNPESTKTFVRDRYATHARTLPDEPDGSPPTLGLGDPVALAGPQPGETVLDLGSGPGRDLCVAAGAVGPAGRAIGVDMTPEMRERARVAAEAAGLRNVSVIDGDLERLPVPCGAVDVVVSNCVINLVPDKRRALVEAFRVLRPGGRFAVLDMAFDAEPGEAVRSDVESWSCCVGGALVEAEYADTLRAIGFTDVRVDRIEEACGQECTAPAVHAVAVTARKPDDAGPGPGVRPAVPADLPAIERLCSDAGLPLDGLVVEQSLVAVEGDEVVGAAALERHGRASLLRSVVVRADHRRRGVGLRLVAGALDVARWSGAAEVYLLTTGAQRYFERFGFVPVSRKRAASAIASAELSSPACESAVAMRLGFEEADLPLLGRPSRKALPTFQDGSCC